MTLIQIFEALQKFSKEQDEACNQELTDVQIDIFEKRRAELSRILAPVIVAAVEAGIVEVAYETQGVVTIFNARLSLW